MIVAFAGQKGSGKTLAASFLADRGFRAVNFADPLKRYLADLGFTHEQLHGGEKESRETAFGVSAREAMQRLGEFTKELLGRQVYVNAAAAASGDVVIGDLRFLAEAQYLQAVGATIIYLDRDTKKNEYSTHVSEQEVLAIRELAGVHIIANMGSRDDLRDSLLSLLNMQK